jgi:hypothetical protein
VGGNPSIQLIVFVYSQFIFFIFGSCFYLLTFFSMHFMMPIPLHGWSSVLFFRTDVLTSKFGGVRFAPSFPSLPVMYLYSHIGDNVPFKFGGKECPFDVPLFIRFVLKKKKKNRECVTF